MRTVAALFLALVAAQYNSAHYTDEDRAIFDKMVNTCVEVTELSKDDLETFKKRVLPESPTGKCFIACLMEQMGVMKDGHLFQEVSDSIVEKIYSGNEDKIAKGKEESRKCHALIDEQKITDKCEKAFIIKKCYMENIYPME